MIAFGAFVLKLALAVTLAGLIAALGGVITRRPPLLDSARRCVHVNFVLISISTLSLVAAFLEPAGVPMTLKYVASNSSRDMAAGYKLAALWGGMSGSLLFWAFLLALFCVVSLLGREVREHVPFMSGTVFTMLLVQAFFLVLMVSVAGCQPFEMLDRPRADGRGLNPLLQHPAMAIHPPLLYTGFVAITIPFAHAMGALLSGRLDSTWIKMSRRWTIFGWSILSIGIVLGGFWAYVELGWGGIWAWDPVENASLMPWLVMTAFLHSVMIQEHRGMLKVWNMVLVQLSFLMTIFGTFLTRSGVLQSVHTFAQNEGVYYMFIGFMGLLVVGGAALVIWRVRTGQLKSQHKLESFLSREFMFLANNVVFLTLTLTILVGTTYPVISRSLFGEQKSMGPPWFNLVTIPQFLLVLLLLGVGPLISWRKASRANLVRNFVWPSVFGLAVYIGSVLFISRSWYWEKLGVWASLAAAGVFGGCAFVLGTLVLEFWRGTASRVRRLEERVPTAFVRLCLTNRRRYGGYVAHFAILLVMIGFTTHSAFKIEIERTVSIGESFEVGEYRLLYARKIGQQRPEYKSSKDEIHVYRGETFVTTLHPANRFYEASDQTTSEVALHKTVLHDLYVVTVGRPGPRKSTFLVFVNPLIDLVFVGVILLALGALFAAWPGGKRRARKVGGVKVIPEDLRISA